MYIQINRYSKLTIYYDALLIIHDFFFENSTYQYGPKHVYLCEPIG